MPSEQFEDGLANTEGRALKRLRPNYITSGIQDRGREISLAIARQEQELKAAAEQRATKDHWSLLWSRSTITGLREDLHTKIHEGNAKGQEVARLQQVIEEIKVDCAQAEVKYYDLIVDRASLASLNDELSNELKTSKEALATATLQASQATSDLFHGNKQGHQLNDDLDLARKQIEELNNELKTSKEAAASATSHASQASSDLFTSNWQNKQFHEELDLARKQIEGLNNELKTSKEAAASATSEASHASSDLFISNWQNEQFSDELELAHGEIEELKQQLQDEKDQEEEHRSAMQTQYQDERVRLRQRLTDALLKNRRDKAEVKESAKRLNRAEARIRRLEGEIGQLQQGQHGAENTPNNDMEAQADDEDSEEDSVRTSIEPTARASSSTAMIKLRSGRRLPERKPDRAASGRIGKPSAARAAPKRKHCMVPEKLFQEALQIRESGQYSESFGWDGSEEDIPQMRLQMYSHIQTAISKGDFEDIELDRMYTHPGHKQFTFIYRQPGEQKPRCIVIEDFMVSRHFPERAILPRFSQTFDTNTDLGLYGFVAASVVACLPECQYDAATEFLSEDELKTFRKKAFGSETEFVHYHHFKTTHPKDWKKIVGELRRESRFITACRYWAIRDEESQEPHRPWPPTFVKRAVQNVCTVFECEAEMARSLEEFGENVKRSKVEGQDTMTALFSSMNTQ